MPDYTKQLDAIVAALNHPTTPAWVIAVLSAILGLISGILGQSLLMPLSDWNRRNRMRRVLYIDLGELFLVVDSIMEETTVPEAIRSNWQVDNLRMHVQFKGEQYIKANPDIYVQLSERLVAETIYLRFHELMNDKDWKSVNAYLARQIFADYVHDGHLKIEQFRKYMNHGAVDQLARRVDAIWNEKNRMLAAMSRPAVVNEDSQSKPTENLD